VEAVEDAVFFAVAVPLALVLSASAEFEDVRAASGAARGSLVEELAVAGAVLAALLLAAWLGWRGHLGRPLRRLVRRVAVRARRPLRRFAADARGVASLVARRGKGRFALTVALTAVQWTARYSIATAVIVYLGGPFRPVLFWVLGWFTYAVASAAPTPGAAGATEATFALLHDPFVPEGILAATTALWRLLLFYVPVLASAALFPLLGLRRADAGRPGETAARSG
jgi:uncharacterized membrane protein YbhN (UPF0104 family)